MIVRGEQQLNHVPHTNKLRALHLNLVHQGEFLPYVVQQGFKGVSPGAITVCVVAVFPQSVVSFAACEASPW